MSWLLGDLIGVQAHRIVALFRTKTLPEPPRAGRNRIIPADMVPAIKEALRDRGWLPVAKS